MNACKKCGYTSKDHRQRYGVYVCKICSCFAPDSIADFQKYIKEKIDWKVLETFRHTGHVPGKKQLLGMQERAKKGHMVSRTPWGYMLKEGVLEKNEDSLRVYSLFSTFMKRNYSLNFLAKNFGLSVNGLKKILTNRAYLGEVKFAGKIYKGNHEPLINPDMFYAVQRKLEEKLKKK